MYFHTTLVPISHQLHNQQETLKLIKKISRSGRKQKLYAKPHNLLHHRPYWATLCGFLKILHEFLVLYALYKRAWHIPSIKADYGMVAFIILNLNWYGPSFKRLGHKLMGKKKTTTKKGSIVYSTDQKKKLVSKKFIIWLPVYEEEKQVWDKRFDSHSTGIRKWKFYWLMVTIEHYNSFLLKVKSRCKCTMLKKFIWSKTKSTVIIRLSV